MRPRTEIDLRGRREHPVRTAGPLKGALIERAEQRWGGGSRRVVSLVQNTQSSKQRNKRKLDLVLEESEVA